jgi:hypothetical protein
VPWEKTYGLQLIPRGLSGRRRRCLNQIWRSSVSYLATGAMIMTYPISAANMGLRPRK